MRRIVIITVICAFAAAPLSAAIYGTVEVQETSVNPGTNMEIYSSGYNGSVLAGIYNLAIEDATNTFGGYLDDGPIDSFCIDVWDYAPSNTLKKYVMVSLNEAPDPGAGPMGPTKAGHLAQLLDNEWHGALDYITAAALQIAVWEVVDESEANPYVVSGVSGGDFWVKGDTDVIDLANEMLADIDTSLLAYDFTNYIALSNNMATYANEDPMGYYQDYVVKTPIPASVILGLLGMGVVGLKLRKFA